MKRACSLIICIVLMTACTAGDPGSVLDTSGGSFARPDYIDEMFRRVSLGDPTDLYADLNSREGQFHMQTLPAVGREDLHADVEGWSPVAGQCYATNEPGDDVMSTIAGLAADTRIVIVNEAHDRPHHRDFTRRLATTIAPLGYTHFAAEAFDPDTFANDAIPYARTNWGMYINEPVFGSLVRTAKQLGLAPAILILAV